MKKSKKKIRLIIVLIVIVLLAAGAVLLIHFKGKNTGAEIETTTREAQRMTIEQTIESDGEIQSSLEENLAPHTSYYLKKIVVEEGDALKEGDTILTYTNGYKMKAPYDCVVESWYLPESGTQLTTDYYVTVAGTDVMMLELSIDEDEIADIEKGTSAEVAVEATGQTYEGEVSYISEVGDYSGGTSTFTARVEFDNDGSVKLGMTGTASILLAKAENVIAVPVDAVHSSGSESYVTLESGEETQVQTGLSNDSYIAIIAGLDEGDKVLVPESDDDSSGFDMGGMPGGDMPGGSGGGEMPSGGGGGGMPSGGGGKP